MTWAVLCLIPVAFLIAAPVTALVRWLGTRLGTLDGAGVAGQVKAAVRRVPNTGGVAIFAAIAGPMALLLAAANTPSLSDWLGSADPAISAHMPGLASQTGAGAAFLAGLLVLHAVGLVDDRRPLGPWLKLAVMAAVAAAVVLASDSRLLTLLDNRVPGGWALSVLLTVLWIIVVTNAFNFMDNMDGLSAGVAAIASSCFLGAALMHERPQWFVAGSLALVVGACLGFLVFNFPRRERGATIFMGDGGSLVLGFTLAFLTVRTTYLHSAGDIGPAGPSAWYAVLMPVVILAVPLYDFVSVCVIRIAQGRSPFVGDLQHLSHRIERHGLSRRASVLVIYGLTAITAIGGVHLPSAAPWQARLIALQTLVVLCTLAVYEGRRADRQALRGGGR